MCNYHGMAHRLLTPGTLLVAVVAMVLPAARGVPAAAGASARAAPLATASPPAESSKVILADTSVDGPALWTSNPGAPNLGLASVLAWIGTNSAHSINIMRSSDGVTYGGKVTFAESSATRPAVAVQGPPTSIVLAWTGTNANHSLNLLCQGAACGASDGTYKKVTFGDNSFTSPALVRFGGGYLLAWAGTDPNHTLNVWPFSLTTSGSGFQMGTKTILSQFSSVSSPSLALNPQNNQLLLTWDAKTPADHLVFATSSNGTTWTNYGLNETSTVGPSGFAVAAMGMPPYWMAWTGTDSAHSLNVRDTSSFPVWPLSDMTTLAENALGGPALGYVGIVGQTLLAWTGTDTAHHLNVATLASAGTPTLDQRIDTYIAGLSTPQLIGQTLMMSVCTSSYSADSTNLNQALTQWDVGNVIIYTSCNGGPTEPPTAAGLQQLDHDLQSHADHAGTLLISTDEEGGTVDRLAPYYGSTPSAQQLGASGNPQNAYNQAQTDAGRMRSLDLNADFAPVVDVYQGGGEGPSRMFGTTVGTVTTYAGAFLDGLQQHGVAGTLKHWHGIGAATGNPDNTLPTINQTQGQLQTIDFAPFANLQYEHPGLIMVTTVMVPAYDANAPADLSSTLVTTVLRGQLSYQGVVITDALGAQSIIIYMRGQGFSDPTKAIAEASVRAFVAGDDLLLAPLAQSDLQAIVSAMTRAVQSGRISQTHLKAAVHRILRLKVEQGLISLP
jgi:beta-N-acetylhexosaminidase